MFNQEVKAAIERAAQAWNRIRDGQAVRLTFIEKDGMFIVKRERRFAGSFRLVEQRWCAYFGDTRQGIGGDYDNLDEFVMSYIEMNCDSFGNKKCVETRYKEQ